VVFRHQEAGCEMPQYGQTGSLMLISLLHRGQSMDFLFDSAMDAVHPYKKIFLSP